MAAAALGAIGGRFRAEWLAGPVHRLALSIGRARALAARPRDFRPPDPERGLRILEGTFAFAGATLKVAAGSDPWDRPHPSRAFAEALHGFAWLGDLIAVGDEGVREALRLILAWRRLFGGWNAFAWASPAVERRTAALACALPTLSAVASDAEIARLLADVGRHARHLVAVSDPRSRAAERLAAAALAAAALAHPAAGRLMDRALRKLERRLPDAVLPDGGHASRSPEAGLELLFDLLSLDDALSQRGRAPPTELARAIDRLIAAVRFFTLADGRLASFQGGGESTPERIAAALAHDDGERRVAEWLRDCGFHRLEGGGLQLIADAGAPAVGVWSLAACAAPGAIEILVGRRRLVSSSAWAAGDAGGETLRLSPAASAVTLDGISPGRILTGFAADVLGPRLIGGARQVSAQRREAEGAVLLAISHDGWLGDLGLTVERSLYLDGAAGELRGEDRFRPTQSPLGSPRRLVAYAVRFHLPPGIRASVAVDGRSVLLRPPGEPGWWLRNDAGEVSVELSVRMEQGAARAAQVVVLAGHFRIDSGGRVRWKLERG